MKKKKAQLPFVIGLIIVPIWLAVFPASMFYMGLYFFLNPENWQSFLYWAMFLSGSLLIGIPFTFWMTWRVNAKNFDAKIQKSKSGEIYRTEKRRMGFVLILFGIILMLHNSLVFLNSWKDLGSGPKSIQGGCHLSHSGRYRLRSRTHYYIHFTHSFWSEEKFLLRKADYLKLQNQPEEVWERVKETPCNRSVKATYLPALRIVLEVE